MSDATRRQFIGTGAACVGASVVGVEACKSHAPDASITAAPGTPPAKFSGHIPRRPLGSTGAQVSIIGLGGFHLGQAADLDEAKRIVGEALDAGVNFFDNAWEYNDGKSEDFLGKALKGKRDRAFLMTKVCSHGRDRTVAMKQLEDSLGRLGTDHLDLWQIHECVYENDPDLHFAPDGVVRALEDAKKQGKVRFVGFTGHKHPRIHQKMLDHGFAFDTVQMPLNCFDASFRSFEQEVLPIALQKKMGVIGMKSLGGHGRPIIEGAVTIEEALRYAMSVPGVSVTVSGVDSLEILHQNLAIAGAFKPMTEAEMKALRERVAPLAADGHFELYKTTTHFDAKVGREQHGYPKEEELPL
ncbi:MAG TPA: aldo/keto reductase [Polyangiaceae bacterium]|jgi:aryl-alcohol dehydrogenase-like predicted oxidoreductase|nr:aldo/keto reductase [Polyangiaceae bacterium]